MERPLSWPLTPHWMKSGAQLSGRPIWSQTIDLSQTLTLRCQCKSSSSTMLWQLRIERALLLVDFRLTLNCSTRPLGKQRKILTQTLLELSTGTDIIKQNLSTSHAYWTRAAGWKRTTKHTIFKTWTQQLTGSLGPQTPKSMLQDRVLSTRASSTSRSD